MADKTTLADTGERLISEGNEQTLTYGEHLSRYLSVTELTAHKIVLDVASGTGYGTQLIAERARKVVGLDYNPEAIAYSEQHHQAKNTSYIVGDAQAMPFEAKSFDVVVSFETIEHLPHPAQFIDEVKRVLTPAGMVIISTPNDAEFMEGNQFHVHEFNLAELKRLVEQKFRHVKFYYQGTFFSAALLPEKIFTKGGTWQGFAHKTFPQDKTRAIFFVVVASDKPFDDDILTKNVVLADIWSTKHDLETDQQRQYKLHELEQRVTSSDRTAQSFQAKAEALERETTELNRQLVAMRTSLAWRTLRTVRHPIRTALRRLHKEL